MLGLETLTLDKETAITKYQEALLAEKVNKSKHLTDLKKVYWQLSKGHKIIDLFETLKKLPFNQDGDPAIGIAPLDAKTCHFLKMERGAGIYAPVMPSSWKVHAGEIRLPQGTFKEWQNVAVTFAGRTSNQIKNQRLSATVPVVPPQFAHLLKGADRFIIFDVQHWVPAPPDDPIICRRITANLFAIEAKFNLTKIEKAIIRGHL